MHYTGEVYRHPLEGYTTLLEVTAGCSHNKCSFCTMYQQTPFCMSPLAHVEEDLKELKARVRTPLTRVFLVNADPFVMTTEKLLTIGRLIRKYFPEMETITCYSSIQNLFRKSVEELKELRAMGYNDLHIGLESGYEPAVTMMNKGFTIEQARQQLGKLAQAGIRYDALLMLGVAGKGNSRANAQATAQLLNETKPFLISVVPTSVAPGSPLDELCRQGIYVEQTELEMLEEEKMLLQGLEIPDAYWFGGHNFNLVPVSGFVREKEEMIRYLDEAIATLPTALLNSVKERGQL